MKAPEFLKSKGFDIANEYVYHRQKEVIQLLEEYASQYIPEWIPVTERLPELDGFFSEWVFAYDKYNGIVKAYYSKNDGWVICGIKPYVTHWMPLPEPPKK
jgi:hypothetical protein